jgi:alkylation response protein AidB-like acyl-CoA dehydrogenase
MSKPVQTINRYKADLREFNFLLFEQFKLQDLLGKEPFAAWGPDEIKTSLTECYRFVREVTGPLNASGDAQGCRLENGAVKTPDGFKEAWDKLYEAGWKSISVNPDHGGAGAPSSVRVLVEELISGSNTAFSMYPGLAHGASAVIEAFGTPEQKALYCERLFTGKWAGTMCLTEPQAGSDVGSARTTAKRNPDGTYSITGTKIFISAGDVKTAAIEHKMGINGSSTCVLNYGEDGGCIGVPVGGESKLNQGMPQMFHLMNGARIGVGLQGVGVASAAFLNALEYAKERKQGSNIAHFKDATAPRVPIIEHADVRRMLLDMKARVEGIRALILKLAVHDDSVKAIGATDDAARKYHQGQVDLLVPLVKAYGSDQAFVVCEEAIQTYGGAGYTRDYPVEQYCRDAKIFSIYEGTNHIQAMDLVGRKLGQAGGANLQAYLGDVAKFVAKHEAHPTFGTEVKRLGRGQEALAGSAMKLLSWFQSGRIELVPLNANRFLRMMSELTVAWLLLEGGIIAEAAAKDVVAGHPDAAFYAGKVQAALYYARTCLPDVEASAKAMAEEDRTPLDISDASFATV